jgi:hypothetical protein
MGLQRLPGAILYNDAKACFERIIENISNLSLLQQGLPLPIAKLHAQTYQQIQYHMKHRLIIGDNHHSHNNPSPVYGAGQGASDAPARWCYLCDKIINIYKQHSTSAHINSPLSDLHTNQQIADFIDNITTLLIKHNATKFLRLFLEQDAKLWERLLYTIGGKLEI